MKYCDHCGCETEWDICPACNANNIMLRAELEAIYPVTINGIVITSPPDDLELRRKCERIGIANLRKQHDDNIKAFRDIDFSNSFVVSVQDVKNN